MKWSRLKTFAIAVLLILDIVFLAVIVTRHRAMQKYDDRVVEEAIGIFRESGLIVQKSLLRGRMTGLSAYAGVYDDSAREQFLSSLQNEDARARLTLDGIVCERESGSFVFGNDFSFSYRRTEKEEQPKLLWAERTEQALVTDVRTKADLYRTALRFFTDQENFLPGENKDISYGWRLSEAYAMRGGYVACLYQTIADTTTENSCYLYVRENRVMAVDGVLAPVAVKSEFRAECVELLDILVSEKNRLEALYRESGAFSPPYRMLSSIETEYMLYFDVSGEFYFVPVCRLRYTDGETVLYHFITGDKIEEYSVKTA